MILMRRIKVLLITQAAGGVQKHVLYLANGLDKSRFEVVAACPPKDRVKGVDETKQSFAQALKNAGIPAVLIDMGRSINPIRDFTSFFKIYNLIMKEKFDVVHSHSSKAGFLARLAAKLLNTPVIVYTPNAFAFDKPGKMNLNGIFYLLLERLAARWCDAIVAVSESEREAALKYKVAPPYKITVINNAIDMAEFDFMPQPNVITKRKELGISDDANIVISVARLSEQKAPFDFIEAASLIIGERKDTVFIIAGDGPLLKKAREFVTANHLDNYIKILGWRTDIKELISLSRLFVLASLWEGMPYTVMEAMELKKPVIATSITGTRDLVVDGYNGYLVPVHRPDLIAERIKELIDSPEKSKEMGEKGRRFLEERTNLKGHIQATEKLYLELLNNKSKKE